MAKKVLKEGDVVIVSNALFGEREYLVKKIIGNKAITDFRTFNIKIYPGDSIYEFGKQAYSTTNGYWVKRHENITK